VSKAGGKVSVSGAVPGFASLGVQIFGNGRWGGAGRDDGLALGSLIINGLGSRTGWNRAGGRSDLPLLLRWADCKSESSPWADTVRLHGRYNGGRVMTKKKKKRKRKC